MTACEGSGPRTTGTILGFAAKCQGQGQKRDARMERHRGDMYARTHVSIAPMRAILGVVPRGQVEVQAEVEAEEPQLPCLFVGRLESVRGVS